MEDSRLFLIQYLPAEAPAVYRVTAWIWPAATSAGCRPLQDPARADAGDPGASGVRPGRRRSSTRVHDGTPRRAQDYGGGLRRRKETFVHVLNLKRGWAYCAGLPRRSGASRLRPRRSRRPQRVGALHRRLDAGAVACMNTQTLQIERMEKVDAPGWAACVRGASGVATGRSASARPWTSRRLRDRHDDARGRRTAGR